MNPNCQHCCGPLNTGGKCPTCDPMTTITITPNITYTWICPKCGSQCSMQGFCPHCGWWAAPQPPAPTGWRCPGCGRYHGPHVNTCPFCQPAMAPNPWPWPWPTMPYVGDPPVYIGEPPYWHNTCGSIVVDMKDIYVGDPPGSVSCDSVSCGTDMEGIVFGLS